jgi:hypothetical protein
MNTDFIITCYPKLKPKHDPEYRISAGIEDEKTHAKKRAVLLPPNPKNYSPGNFGLN